MAAIIVTIACTLAAVTLLLNFRTPEKKPHHKIQHLFGIQDRPLKREMGALLGPGIVTGNRIQPLQNGDEIFPAMLAAVRGAKRTITFETFIYWAGSVGEELAAALILKAREGVRVHVMLDWVGASKISNQLVEKMTEVGIEVVRYHPIRWYSLTKLNNRTHRKMLVIDGMLGFTGGVGIADQWSGNAQDPEHWRDMHFQVEGYVVAQMQAAFLDNWIKTTGVVLHGEGYFPELRNCGDQEMQMFTSSPQGGSGSMRLMYLMAITAAVHSVDIEAAYFVPDKLMSGALIAARVRGVRIRVIVPGKYIDSATVGLSSQREWGPLIEHGVEISTYEPTMIHCKCLIFDRYMVSVGSTNFDMRSFELNDEASLNVYDVEFAASMTDVFEQDLRLSSRVTLKQWQNRPWRQKLAEKILVPLRSQL